MRRLIAHPVTILLYVCVSALLVWGAGEKLQPAALTASVALLVGGLAWSLQGQVLEFQRWAHRPSLVVNKGELDGTGQPAGQKNVICIENCDSKVASNVYIGSFFFTDDGKDCVPLYDEIAPAVVKEYRIAQSDVLKPPFRQAQAAEDRERYKGKWLEERFRGKTLEERIDEFLKLSKGFYLVIAIRDRAMNDRDMALFFFANRGTGKVFDFDSRHFAAHVPFFRNVAKVVSERYRQVLKESQAA